MRRDQLTQNCWQCGSGGGGSCSAARASLPCPAALLSLTSFLPKSFLSECRKIRGYFTCFDHAYARKEKSGLES